MTSGTSFSWWYLSAVGGANYYFSGTAPKGLYAGGGLGLGYTSISYSGTSASGFSIEPVAHLGYRFIWGFFSLAPEVGVSYTMNLFDFSSLGLGSTYSVGGFGYSLGLGMAIAF